MKNREPNIQIKSQALMLFLTLLASLSSTSIYSQWNLKGNQNIYAQLNPFEEYYSLRYENSIISNNQLQLNGYIAISHSVPNFNSLGYKWFGIPIGLNLIKGRKKSHLETGLEYWWTKSYNSSENRNSNTEHLVKVKFGYRFQNLEKNGLIFRIGIAPTFSRQFDIDYWDSDSYLGNYISLGYGF